MTVKFKVRGMTGIVNGFKAKELALEKQLKTGLRSAGEFVKKESVSMTPRDSGALIDSAYGGYDQPVKKYANVLYTEVGYDENIAPYAAQVHEATGKLKGQKRRKSNSVGNYWDDTGEPKFLEKAFFKNVSKIRRIIKSKLKL